MPTTLTVDDSPSVRHVVKTLLSGAGYTMIEGGDGAEGLAKAKSAPVNMIITDLNMPVLNGLELIKNLRKVPYIVGVPIKFLTTESSDGTKQEAKAAGATGWIGELVIARARLSQLAHTRNDGGIQAIAEEIERLASGLRDTTMGIRMVPIGSLFARFRRLIHDLSRDLGKPVEFVTSGEDTELDKTMIERLADPLVHLIRNAVDHGIEGPEHRSKTDKSPVGRIELRAQHVGAQVMVTVRDDDGGLDTARISAKAEKQGLIARGATLSDAEIHQFLFHPGLSTAQTLSALSGRGVGMDVVKRTIEALRGSIDVSTEAGHGSTMSPRLPLTLAIIESLLIRVGDSRYIVPLSMIEECVELSVDQARGRSFLNIRGGLVPFLRLRDLFETPGEPEAHQKIIITSVGETRVGLVVDQIIGSHQTVIKSLSKLHSDATMFSGATILGDGSAALILDVTQLVAIGQQKAELETLNRAA